MRLRRPWLAALTVLLSVACGAPEERPAATVQSPRLSSAAAAVPERRAARVAERILRQGGNAADAAVAVHFALAVTYPIAGNIGGGGFAVLHVPGEEGRALDFRETAPGAAHPELFQDAEGEVIPGLSLHSRLAAGVPGSVAGMWRLHREYGTKPWASLLQPAIDLAAEGFELDEWTVESFADKRADVAELDPELRREIDFSDHFHGEPGDLFRQPELADTLRRIAARGLSGFYEGRTAALLAEEMERGRGAITLPDLRSYEAVWREPISGEFRGWRVVSMPPPSSGGIALVQLLKMWEAFETPAFQSAAHLHLVAEIEKRVFADRARHLGDPDFHPVPAEKLTADNYLAGRIDGISNERRTPPGAISAGLLEPESRETTHYSIVDRDGMGIAVTTTLNAAYGSGIVVDGAGFLLNNEMDDFAAKAGVPNLYGVTGGEANQVNAGKRMLSSMSPTLVFDDTGALRLALGTPGGPTIFTTVFQVIVNHVDYGQPVEQAIAEPRFHHQWPPRPGEGDVIRVERLDDVPKEVTRALEDLGYDLRHEERLGDVQAVEVRDGRAFAHSDPRLVGREVELTPEDERR